jgi:hypothetical protein
MIYGSHYRRKADNVTAIQVDKDNKEDIREFLHNNLVSMDIYYSDLIVTYFNTNDIPMYTKNEYDADKIYSVAAEGDYIVRDGSNLFTMKAEEFETLYEPVHEEVLEKYSEDITIYDRNEIKLIANTVESTNASCMGITTATTGFKGGDAGSGSRTLIKLKDLGGTDWELTKGQDSYGRLTSLELLLRGDAELSNIITCMEAAVDNLKKSVKDSNYSYDLF